MDSIHAQEAKVNYGFRAFTATTGDYANIHCNFGGELWDQKTCIAWKRTPPQLSPDLSAHVQKIGPTLHFDEVNDTDSGFYICQLCMAWDDICAKMLEFTLFLLVKKLQAPQAPRDLYFNGPENTKVRVNETAHFTCNFNRNASDSPQLTWWRILQDSGEIERMNTTENFGVSVVFSSVFAR
jgi:hypothetical protein